MKKKKTHDVLAACIIVALLLLSTVLNVVTSKAVLGDLADEVRSLSLGDSEAAEALGQKFAGAIFFLSITVNHEDLGRAEEYMAELITVIGGDDASALEVAKSRLISALRQIGRLSGAGIDSII